MVFDADAAPRDREEFMAWYDQQTEWSESHGYQDAAVTTPRLRAWLEEIARTFPPINGPSAGDVDDSRATDYSIGRSVIYAAFAWSQANAAYECMVGLAAKHGVGFFDVSSTDARVWLPVDGQLVCSSSGIRVERRACSIRFMMCQRGTATLAAHAFAGLQLYWQRCR